MMMIMPTHCRQGSLEGLFRTASRWGLGADFQQRGPRWDRAGPDDQKSQESLFVFFWVWPLSVGGRSVSSPWVGRTGSRAVWEPPTGCLQSSEPIPWLKVIMIYFLCQPSCWFLLLCMSVSLNLSICHSQCCVWFTQDIIIFDCQWWLRYHHHHFWLPMLSTSA